MTISTGNHGIRSARIYRHTPVALLHATPAKVICRARIEFRPRARRWKRHVDRAHRPGIVSAQVSDDGAAVELTVRNTGQTKLADFDQWDLILQYYDAGAAYHIVWVPYEEANPPAPNTWSVEDIALDVYDPGIFNPGETITVQFKVSPAVGPETTTRWPRYASGIGVHPLY
jgi:hypothetical protein